MRGLLLSRVQLIATPQVVVPQAVLFRGFSRQEYWSGLLLPPPDPGIEPESPVSPALAGGSFTTSTTWEALKILFHD